MFISIALAKIIGLYCVLTGLAMLFDPARFKKMAQDFMQFPVVLDFTGIIALILGLILVVIHNVWVLGWPVLVTIMAWLILLKGVTVLFMPKIMIGMDRKMSMVKTCCFMGMSVVTLVIGLVFCYYGFIMQ